jgi:hypothetical protein
LKKQQKSDGYGGCFPSQPQFYYSGLAYINWHNLKKSKRKEMGLDYLGRRQRINDKLQHTTW